MTDYHVVTSCNKCKGANDLVTQDFDSGHLHEATTKCNDCGFEDYWAHGFFESGTDMVSKCKKYTPQKRFKNVYCSSCGEDFGPADSGFSHCDSHAGMMPIEVN